MVLPVNIDSTYADSGTDASVALHQQHHDTIHTAVNGLLLRSGERTVERCYTIIDGAAVAGTYTSPSRVRPYEVARKQVRVRNLGTTSIQVAYGTANNNNFNSPAAGQWTANPVIAPGEEWVDNFTSAGLFVRPNTSGQGYRIGVYAEIGLA